MEKPEPTSHNLLLRLKDLEKQDRMNRLSQLFAEGVEFSREVLDVLGGRGTVEEIKTIDGGTPSFLYSFYDTQVSVHPEGIYYMGHTRTLVLNLKHRLTRLGLQHLLDEHEPQKVEK